MDGKFDIFGLLGNFVDPAVIAVALAAFGVAMLLFGYKLFKLYLFIVGLAAGYLVASFFTTELNALIAGLVCGILNIFLWYLGVFACGAALGFCVCFFSGIDVKPVVYVVMLAGGILALLISKFIIIVSSSWTGATSIVAVLDHYTGIDESQALAISIGLAIAGVICQYTITSGKSSSSAPVPTADEVEES